MIFSISHVIELSRNYNFLESDASQGLEQSKGYTNYKLMLQSTGKCWFKAVNIMHTTLLAGWAGSMTLYELALFSIVKEDIIINRP